MEWGAATESCAVERSWWVACRRDAPSTSLSKVFTRRGASPQSVPLNPRLGEPICHGSCATALQHHCWILLALLSSPQGFFLAAGVHQNEWQRGSKPMLRRGSSTSSAPAAICEELITSNLGREKVRSRSHVKISSSHCPHLILLTLETER